MKKTISIITGLMLITMAAYSEKATNRNNPGTPTDVAQIYLITGDDFISLDSERLNNLFDWVERKEPQKDILSPDKKELPEGYGNMSEIMELTRKIGFPVVAVNGKKDMKYRLGFSGNINGKKYCDYYVAGKTIEEGNVFSYVCFIYILTDDEVLAADEDILNFVRSYLGYTIKTLEELKGIQGDNSVYAEIRKASVKGKEKDYLNAVNFDKEKNNSSYSIFTYENMLIKVARVSTTDEELKYLMENIEIIYIKGSTESPAKETAQP